jgi:hypothetical protein
MYIWEIGNHKKAFFSVLNGKEPPFNPKKWNDDVNIKKTHNCYAYMLDIISKSLTSKPQPGYASGYSYLRDSDLRSCDKMFERIKADNPSALKTTFHQKCPEGYRKGYLALDSTDDTDYHFYRLDKDGYWSHKPGATEAISRNYDGKLIKAPHNAKRESSSHKYETSCGYFCFDPKQTNISNKPGKKSR